MGSWAIKIGSKVYFENREAIVKAISSLETVQIKQTGTDEFALVPLSSLTHAPRDESLSGTFAYEYVSDEQWYEAKQKELILKPLLDKRTTLAAKAAANAAGVHISTIYRRLGKYTATLDASSQIRHKPNGGRGKGRLGANIEKSINYLIDIKTKKSRIVELHELAEKIQGDLRRIYGGRAPCKNTIKARILASRLEYRMTRSQRNKKDKNSSKPIRGKFPDADYPLAVVQIDHTKVDIQVVDEQYREPIGRPFISVLIDVYSRMILGFCLSLDPPGTIGTSLALAHAILPKEKWLAKIGVEGSYPTYGVMKKIHADNAGEFHGKTLAKGCFENDIGIIWRPLAHPEYGAHIERYMRTFGEFIHRLPGTTFSNIEERGDYDSEKEAVLTLTELERIITRFIVNIYHQKKHSALGMSPIKKYEEGILGDGIKPGMGLPSIVTDETRLRLDFLPYEERTVQRYGIVWDHITYYSNALRRWICEKDPSDKRKMRKFIVRRDPRDISIIYFYDPELGQYFEIPYADISRAPMSIWEHKFVRRRLEEQGKDINEFNIFEEHEKIMADVELSAKKSKSARRMKQRRANHHDVLPELPVNNTLETSEVNTDEAIDQDIKPFEEDISNGQ